MRLFATAIAFLLLFATLQGQSLKKRLAMSERENDSLRMELEKCHASPFLKLSQHLENPTFPETPVYSREELHAKLLPQIQLKSAEKYAVASMVIERTNGFVAYCKGLSDVLIARAGGADSLKTYPQGYRNTAIGAKLFLEEGKGRELQSNINDLRNTCLKIVQGNTNFEARIVLQVEPVKAGKTWEEFKFKGMPLAAIFPILGKLQADAEASEIAVLQYLNE